MHLEVASIPRARRRPLARQDLLDGGAAEILPPQVVQARDLLFLARLPHGAFDERAVAVENQLTRDAVGGRPDAGDCLERVRGDKRRDGAIDPQHRFRRALVAPRALGVAGNGRHVVQQAGKLEVDVPHGQFVDIPCGWLVVTATNHRPPTNY